MSQLLFKYMSQRMEKAYLHKQTEGPIITISRETGCDASEIAVSIVESIQNKYKKNWRIVSKHILHELAKELKMHPDEVASALDNIQQSMADNLFSFLQNRMYPTEHKIRRKNVDVIRSFAAQGNLVIIGRGSEVVTQGRDKTLHVRLFAPFEWRLESITSRYGYTRDDGINFLNTTDQNRKQLKDYICKQNSLPLDDSLYELKLNCSSFTKNDLAGIIVNAAEARGLFR